MFSKIILLLVLRILGSLAWSVNLYDQENYKGGSISLTGSNNDCLDVPNDFKPLSVDTQGFCLRFFAEKQCRGETMAFFPDSRNHEFLSQYQIEKKSFRSCNSYFQWIVLCLAFEVIGGNCWAVMLFSEEEFKGNSIALTGKEDECVNIPDYFVILSMATQGYCLRVFREKNCEGETLAFFPGSLYHHVLKRYKFHIKSMRSCSTSF